jgi:hypothetical protein
MTVRIFLSVWLAGVIPKILSRRSMPIKDLLEKNNREFLHMNKMKDCTMTKARKGTELTPYEKDRNKPISKVRYKVVKPAQEKRKISKLSMSNRGC